MPGSIQDVGESVNSKASEGSRRLFHEIRREVQWQTMYRASGEVPRLVCAQGKTREFKTQPPSFTASITDDVSISANFFHKESQMTGYPLYRHPSDQSLSLQPLTPVVERTINQPVNHCLLQLYRSGQDFTSEHSNKTLDIERGSRIVDVSLGKQRKMRLRKKRLPKGTKTGDEASIHKSRSPARSGGHSWEIFLTALSLTLVPIRTPTSSMASAPIAVANKSDRQRRRRPGVWASASV